MRRMNHGHTRNCSWSSGLFILAAASMMLGSSPLSAQRGTPAARSIDVLAYFIPSGWMGDGADVHARDHVTWNSGWLTNCHGEPPCVKVTYTAGRQGWAGIYLQSQNSNWGQFPGRDLSGFRRLSFWARADSATAPTAVEFKAGGIYDPRRPYRDSFEISLGSVVLTPVWRRFSIDLAGANLTSVIGGFAWVATGAANPRGVSFVLADLVYER